MNPKICEGPSSSKEDRNANINDEINISRGAIPKTKNYLKNSQIGKKNIKLNNNFESINSSNYVQTPVNLCKNGFSKPLRNGIETEKPDSDWDYRKSKLEETKCEFHFNNDSDTSSSDDNDSVSDDGCIYTYKADSIPDLPVILNNLDISFFNNEARESNSSPEMDFLEMDFEPEPTIDPETEQAVSITNEPADESRLDLNLRDFNEPNSLQDSNDPLTNDILICEEGSSNFEQSPNVIKKKTNTKKVKKEIKMPWSCTVEQKTKASKQLRIIRTDTSSGEDSMVSIVTNEEKEEHRVLIWSHEEAYVKQITQIGPLSCGATAVLNVLIALRLPVPSLEIICNCRKPDVNSKLLTYLQSKSMEGCGHRELISGLHKASNCKIYARFFSMYPERCVNLCDWLSFWIRQGAIPIATFNLQKSQHPIPDSWCHQMIYGVDSHDVYLTNPIERVDAGVLWHQLVSESVLLVRREKILEKFEARRDLSELRSFQDVSYDELNVLGQVARVIRESSRRNQENTGITSHIKIPTAFRSGITLAIDKGSKAYPLLLECPELPLLNLNTCKP